MRITVEQATVVDRHHHNGDPYWDGDQTLYELTVADGHETAELLFVVARGDAYIAGAEVANHVVRLGLSVSELSASVDALCRSGTRKSVSAWSLARHRSAYS